MAQGSFIISLDFELAWGVRDVVRIRDKREHFLRARESIPEVLRLFASHEVHATWATVGFLFARDKRHLMEHLPSVRPSYTVPRFDPYLALSDVGEDERSDPFHYAPSILQAISETPGQEIGSHTFSHYYCLEDGQTLSAFEADLDAARAIGAPFGEVTSSLVFPRGQYNPTYRHVLRRHGVRTYRLPSSFFAYRPRQAGRETFARRALRLVDSYLPLGGFHTDKPVRDSDGVVALRAGLFLRPFSPVRRRLEPARLRRLKRAMRHAASKGRDFHLWWHPHNFGAHTAENLQILEEVLREYRTLRERHAWASLNMAEASGSAGSPP
jgi:peptidoglycan/xylan/chitin deacetylase (PgdA/CDA1 family)